jgi:hypothetical protein
METQNTSGAGLRDEILQDLQRNCLDAQYLKLIRDNDEVFNSFRDLFMQLKGSTQKRINLINQVIFYVRNQNDSPGS